MNELEERAVLARAYPPPSMAEAESALGLVRFRLPARRRRSWLNNLLRVAATLIVVAGTFSAVVRYSALRSRRGEAVMAPPLIGLPTLWVKNPKATMTDLSGFPIGSLVDDTRRFHFRLVETRADGSFRTLRDTTVSAASGSGFRLSGWGSDSLPPGMLPQPGTTADCTAHVMPDGALFVASHRRSVQAPRGESVTFFPNGPPHGGQRRIGLEISMDTAREAVRHVAASGSIAWPGRLTIQLLPRVQGAFVRIEVGDGTTWRTVYDRPKFVLTRMPAVFYLPDTPITEATVSFELYPSRPDADASMCMDWRPPGGQSLDGVCLPDDGSPRIVPIYRPTARMLRITLLESFTRTPWER